MNWCQNFSFTKSEKTIKHEGKVSPWLLLRAGGVSTTAVRLVSLNSLATWQAVSGLSPVIMDT